MLCISLSSMAQFAVGIRDNRFVYGEYTYKGHYQARIEESVFSEKMGYQYLRGYLGYLGNNYGIKYSVEGYFGSAYNRSYYSGGARAEVGYTFFNRLLTDVKLNPHYDSGFGYKTCFETEAGVVITRNIDVLISYTTIPEYRMSENRVHLGFDFHIKGLSVKPQLSLATDGASKAKNLRMLLGFKYSFFGH